MNADGNKLLGIDIGGTKTALIVGTADGRILERVAFASEAQRGAEPMLADILTQAAAIIGRHAQVVAVGASIGGPVDAETGMVLGPPNLPGWDAVPLTRLLSERLHLPARIEHDAKACALAEFRYGAGRGSRHMVFLTLGTGVGAGIIANGKLLRGAGNLAGEIGHWGIEDDGPRLYGKAGSLEGWASGAGLPALARFLHPNDFAELADAAEVATRWRAGDQNAADVVARSATALGKALALIVDLLAPEVIVLGNLANRLGPPFVDMVRAAIDRDALPTLAQRCDIRCCELGEAIGDMAALSVAAEAIEQETAP